MSSANDAALVLFFAHNAGRRRTRHKHISYRGGKGKNRGKPWVEAKRAKAKRRKSERVRKHDSVVMEDYYEAECIQAVKYSRKGILYKVSYTNYPPSASTWEPRENLTQALFDSFIEFATVGETDTHWTVLDWTGHELDIKKAFH